ncbi:MAG: hypothetical protein EBV06_14400 [Planctomycetia bacterium]|nr:hypothetical protein [Planctomycetia bacterium]
MTRVAMGERGVSSPRFFWFVLLLFVFMGCSGGGQRPVPITLDEVPESVMKVARQKLPDVKFERAMRKPNGEYEVIGKNKSGKVREIDIAPDGTVTEIE